jgi:hypothetical protein
MLKLLEIVNTTPGLDYHIKHNLPISENIYRYSSDAFIDLFAEARELWYASKIDLPLPDVDLLENTDIGLWGIYEGQKVPLDLPMLDEARDDSLQDEIENKNLSEAKYKGKAVQLNKPKRGGSGGKKFYVYVKDPKTGNVKKISFGAASGGQNLAVKFKEPGARASFAARHNCKDKKDKTSPGYWSCRLPAYWKSLGGDKNYSGYW